jgi:hypothetical protein
MESEGSEARLDAEWEALAAGKRLVVIDEAQQAPKVFSRLRGTIDADRKRNGRFLLLGSVSLALMANVSESLAGRLGLVRMTPFVLPELKAAQLDDLWLRGGYPDGGILLARMFPEWQGDYLETLATRDLPTWGLTARPPHTMRLLAMLAAVHGQPLNASQLGAALALDHKTVLRYCDFLEGAFLIRRLPPFFGNLKKRLVKTPRLYHNRRFLPGQSVRSGKPTACRGSFGAGWVEMGVGGRAGGLIAAVAGGGARFVFRVGTDFAAGRWVRRREGAGGEVRQEAVTRAPRRPATGAPARRPRPRGGGRRA